MSKLGDQCEICGASLMCVYSGSICGCFYEAGEVCPNILCDYKHIELEKLEYIDIEDVAFLNDNVTKILSDNGVKRASDLVLLADKDLPAMKGIGAKSAYNISNCIKNILRTRQVLKIIP